MENIYSEKAVKLALSLVAGCIGGCVKREYAEEQLAKLPESLQVLVLLNIIAIFEVKEVVPSGTVDSLIKDLSE